MRNTSLLAACFLVVVGCAEGSADAPWSGGKTSRPDGGDADAPEEGTSNGGSGGGGAGATGGAGGGGALGGSGGSGSTSSGGEGGSGSTSSGGEGGSGSTSSGGEGGSGATGGTGGIGGSGATGGTGGIGGSGATSGSGGTGGSSSFSCDESLFSNYACDCGCGIDDPQCYGYGCSTPGCYTIDCDYCYDESGPITCGPPSGWLYCSTSYYADGSCDCGCGAEDPDCYGMGCSTPGCTASACDYCFDEYGSFSCGGGWTCNPYYYGDGSICDCGCGEPDPDCYYGGCSTPGCYAFDCDFCFDEYGYMNECW